MFYDCNLIRSDILSGMLGKKNRQVNDSYISPKK